MEYYNEVKEIMETFEKIGKLQKQKEKPSREEMIKALLEAKKHAPLEITIIEFMQGDRNFMPWEQFSDGDLYRKLSQYQQGLNTFFLRKTGQALFDTIK